MLQLEATLFAITAACGTLAAQSTWIVDVRNGPGTDFTQIATALAAPQVVDGDLVRVRTGIYEPFETAKGVALVGEAGTVVAAQGLPANSTVKIENLPAGRTFAMTNFRVEHSCTNARTAVGLYDNQGRIHFDRVSTQGIGYPTWLIPFCPSIVINRCATVTWNDSRCQGGGGIEVFGGSTVTLSDVESVGLDGQDLTIRYINSTPALTVIEGQVDVAASDLTGGQGHRNVASSPGVILGRSFNVASVRVAGDRNDEVRAGASFTPVPVSAVRIEAGGPLTYDPRVSLVSVYGAPPIGGSGTATARPLAYVTAIGAAVGGPARVTMTSAAGDSVFLALSLPVQPLPTPFGRLFLDPRLLVPLRVGGQDPSGTISLSIPIPGDSILRGAGFGIQAANLHVARNEIALTNPVVIVIR